MKRFLQLPLIISLLTAPAVCASTQPSGMLIPAANLMPDRTVKCDPANFASRFTVRHCSEGMFIVEDSAITEAQVLTGDRLEGKLGELSVADLQKACAQRSEPHPNDSSKTGSPCVKLQIFRITDRPAGGVEYGLRLVPMANGGYIWWLATAAAGAAGTALAWWNQDAIMVLWDKIKFVHSLYASGGLETLKGLSAEERAFILDPVNRKRFELLMAVRDRDVWKVISLFNETGDAALFTRDSVAQLQATLKALVCELRGLDLNPFLAELAKADEISPVYKEFVDGLRAAIEDKRAAAVPGVPVDVADDPFAPVPAASATDASEGEAGNGSSAHTPHASDDDDSGSDASLGEEGDGSDEDEQG